MIKRRDGTEWRGLGKGKGGEKREKERVKKGREIIRAGDDGRVLKCKMLKKRMRGKGEKVQKRLGGKCRLRSVKKNDGIVMEVEFDRVRKKVTATALTTLTATRLYNSN